jgi:hypothetical protein
MINIYSKKYPKKILHIINRLEDVDTRIDLSPKDQFLQVAAIKQNPNKQYKAHQHIWKDCITKKIIAQESWIIIKGSIKAYLFDIDGNLLLNEIIYPGDCVITFEGGHKFDILEKNTVLYECKTGPYLGVEKDKIFY